MLETLLILFHVIVAVFLVILVLLQRSDGGMGSLGGGGGSSSLMSASGTGNALTRTTAILAGCFMVSSMVLAMHVTGEGRAQSVVETMPAAQEEAAPDAPAVPLPPVPEATTEESPIE